MRAMVFNRLCDATSAWRHANRRGPAQIEARLGRIIEVDLQSEQLTWQINEDHLAQARLMDSKLLLVTNVTDLGAGDAASVATPLDPSSLVQRGMSLESGARFH